MDESKLANNKLAQMFNLPELKKQIDECPKDEVGILLPHYSINKPKYTQEEWENGADNDDFLELGDYLGSYLAVSDFDDLVCDPHGILDC
jgi:hypothetical protein